MKNKKVLIGLSLFVALSIVLSVVLVNLSDQGIKIPDDRIPEGAVIDDGSISVHDFGAVGDGVTDDTSAIQRAMDVASQNDLVLKFRDVFTTYRCTRTITVPGNLVIDGNGATLFMEPQDEVTTFLYTNRRHYLDKIEIRNLTIDSEKSIAGTNRLESGIMTSNVQGIFFSGVSNVVLEDVTVTNMSSGIKFGTQIDYIKNENITLTNVTVTDCLNAFYADMTKNLTIENSVLDATGGEDQRLHTAYISGGCEEVTFDGVEFRNSPGAGINFYNGYADKEATTGVKVINSTFENCKVGINLWEGTNNVDISDVTIAGTSMGMSLNTAEDVVIQNVKVERTNTWGPDKGAFMFRDTANITIESTQVDGTDMDGFVFLFFDKNTDINLGDITAVNLDQAYAFYAKGYALNASLVDSLFQWTNLTKSIVSLVGTDSDLLMDNNLFYNSSSAVSQLSYVNDSNSVTMNATQLAGFKNVGNYSALTDTETIFVDAQTAEVNLVDRFLALEAVVLEEEVLEEEISTEETVEVSSVTVEEVEEAVEEEAVTEAPSEETGSTETEVTESETVEEATTAEISEESDFRLLVQNTIAVEQRGKNWFVGGMYFVTIYVDDQLVSGADVRGYWEGAVTYSESDVTNDDGIANFELKNLKVSEQTSANFVVTEVVINGVVYSMQ